MKKTTTHKTFDIHTNRATLSYFRHHNRMSACSLYVLVTSKYNGVIKESYIKDIATQLDTSRQNVYKLIRQCIEIGAISKVSNSRWYLISWKKLPEIGGEQFRVVGQFSVRRNKTIELEPHFFLSKERSQYLRNTLIIELYHSSAKTAKRFCSSKERKKNMPDFVARQGTFYAVSASFVKANSNISLSDNTLRKHLHKGKDKYSSINFKQSVKIVGYDKKKAPNGLLFSTREEAMKVQLHLSRYSGNNRLLIRSLKNKGCYYYQIFEYCANLIDVESSYFPN